MSLNGIDERVGVVETKVQYLNEKIDDLKVDVKNLHDCLDRIDNSFKAKLDEMVIEYRVNRDRYYEMLAENKLAADKAHNDQEGSIRKISDKLDSFEKFKTRGTYIAVGIAAFLAGTGYLTHGEVAKIIKLIAG